MKFCQELQREVNVVVAKVLDRTPVWHDALKIQIQGVGFLPVQTAVVEGLRMMSQIMATVGN